MVRFSSGGGRGSGRHLPRTVEVTTEGEQARIERTEQEPGVDLVRVAFSLPLSAVPAPVTLSFRHPLTDVQGLWRADYQPERIFDRTLEPPVGVVPHERHARRARRLRLRAVGREPDHLRLVATRAGGRPAVRARRSRARLHRPAPARAARAAGRGCHDDRRPPRSDRRPEAVVIATPPVPNS